MVLRIVTALGLSLFALSMGGCVTHHHHDRGYHRGWHHDHDRHGDRDRDRDRDRYHDRRDRDWR